MKQNLVVLLTMLCSLGGFAQSDSLTLLSGRVVTGKVTAVKPEVVKMNIDVKGGTKPAEIDKYRIFSIKYTEGKTQMIYEKDTLRGKDYTVDEMQRLIWGEQDAQKGHKMVFPALLSTAMGIAGGYVMAEEFLVLGVPFVSMLSSTILTPQAFQREAVRDEEKLLHDPSYRTGYKRVRKAKKSKQIVWGSFLGTAIGVVAHVLVK